MSGVALGTAVIGAGMSYGLNQIGSGGGQKATDPGWQWLPTPQLPQAKQAYGNYFDYLSGGLQSLQEGKPPTWFQNWAPLEEKQRKNALTGTYYGKGAGAAGGNFGPGVLATQQGADVAAGRRGAGAGSNYANQLNQYAYGNKQIDDYLSQLGAGAMQQEETNLMNAFPASYQISQEPGAWGSYAGTEAQPSSMQAAGAGLSTAVPYLLSSLTGAGGQNGMGGYFNPDTSSSTALNNSVYASQWNPSNQYNNTGYATTVQPYGR